MRLTGLRLFATALVVVAIVLVVRQLGAGTGGKAATALFASRFREAAARALLLPRRHPRQRAPLWLSSDRCRNLHGLGNHRATFPGPWRR